MSLDWKKVDVRDCTSYVARCAGSRDRVVITVAHTGDVVTLGTVCGGRAEKSMFELDVDGCTGADVATLIDQLKAYAELLFGE